MAGFNDRPGAEIDFADMREGGGHRNQRRRQKANDHNLQMGLAVGAVHRMIHNLVPSFRVRYLFSCGEDVTQSTNLRRAARFCYDLDRRLFAINR